MPDIYKTKEIETNINERGVNLGNVDVTLYTMDKGSAAFKIHLKREVNYGNEKVYDSVNLYTTDMTPRIDIVAADGSVFSNEPIDIVIPENGVIQYIVSDYVIRHAGKMDVYIYLENKSESVQVANFYFYIEEDGVARRLGKEITGDRLDDIVKNVMSGQLMELLSEDYREQLDREIKQFLSDNNKDFNLKFEDLTREEKDELTKDLTNKGLADFRIEDNTIATSKIADGAITPEKTSFIIQSDNLLDKNDVIKNKNLNNTTGELIDLTNFYVFNKWFEVKPGEVYTSNKLNTRVYYDSNKNFISAFIGNGTFTIPEKVRYMRISTPALNEAQLNYGDTLKAYDDYKEPTLSANLLDNNYITTNRLMNNSVTPEKTSFIEGTTNLIDKNNLIHNYAIMYDSNGEPVENSTTALTDFIQIEPLKQYTISTKSHRIAYYDSNKNYIGQDYSGLDPYTFTPPKNAKYIRTNVYITRLNNPMLNKGNTLLPYEDWHKPIIDVDIQDKSITTDKIQDNVITTDKLKDKSITTDKLNFVIESINLIDKNSLFHNYAITYNSNGEPVKNESTSLTDFIHVTPNTIYTGLTGSHRVAFYDTNKKYITETYQQDTKNPITFTTPPNASYLRINVYIKNRETPMLNKGDTILPYEEWHRPILDGVDYKTDFDITKINNFVLDKDLNTKFVAPMQEGFEDYTNLPAPDEYKIDKMYQKIDNMMAQHPEYITKEKLGEDNYGNDIMLYNFVPVDAEYLKGDGVTSVTEGKPFRRPKLLLFTGTHGAERTVIQAMFRLMDLIVNHWDTQEALEFLRFNVDIHWVPFATPTGYIDGTRTNRNKVDPSRNYSADWKNGPNDTSRFDYRGPSAQSEPEMQTLDKLMGREKWDFFVDFHNFFSPRKPNHFNWFLSDTPEVQQFGMKNINKMSRRWSRRFSDSLPQDSTQYGWVSPQIQVGSPAHHATEKYQIPSALMEVSYKLDTFKGSQPNDGNIMTLAVDSIGNFLIQTVQHINDLSK